MKILDEHLHTLWYENADGARHLPNLEGGYDVPPDGFVYQHSAFPCTLHKTVLRLTVAAEVEACAHENTQPTYGWIDGVEGRRCDDCGGTQTRRTGEPWAAQWCSSGSRRVAGGTSSYPAALVLAMARPSVREIALSTIRYGWPERARELPHAILIAANACERCMNALAHRYGLRWGYREGGEEWGRCNTVCRFCDHWPAPAFSRPAPIAEVE